MLARLAAAFAALLGAAQLACTPTCPKDKLEAGTAFVHDLCALQPLTFGAVSLRPGAALATVDLPAAPVTGAMPIFVYADGPNFDATSYPLPDSADALETALKDELEKAATLAERMEKPLELPPLVLAIAADAPAESIVRTIEIAHKAGIERILLRAAAGRGPAIPPLPVPEVRAEVETLAATLSDSPLPFHAAVGTLFQAEIQRCPALADVDADLAAIPHEERCAARGRKILAACEACVCSADVARALSLGLLLDVPDALHVERTVSLAPDATAIATRPGERWSDLAPRVFAASGHAVRLHLEP